MDYLDLDFPSKVYCRKTDFYMQEPAPNSEIGISPFSSLPSRPCNLLELPRDADLPMVHRLMKWLHELKVAGLMCLNLIATRV